MGLVALDSLPGFGDAVALGLKILGLVVMIDLTKQAYRMLRGAEADFPGVLARAVVAAVTITAIPWLSVTLSKAVLGFSNWLFTEAQVTALDRSFRTALTAFHCEEVSSLEALGMLFSQSGLVLLFGNVLITLVVLIKLLVIDVLWPLFFAVVVYMGVITVPISFLEDMGGLRTYARNVASIAMWPIMFAFLMCVIAALFPKAIAAVADGQVSLECGVKLQLPEGEGGTSGVSNAFWGVMKYLAICLAVVWLTVRTPTYCAQLLGAESPASLARQMISGVTSKVGKSTGVAGKAMKGRTVARIGRS